MNINSLYASIHRAPSAPRLNPQEIRLQITEWFQKQQFRPIVLTGEQRVKLREHLSRVCSERKQIDSLVNYVGSRTLFDLCPVGMDPLIEILEKEKPSIADYKYLLGAANALFSACENYQENPSDRLIYLNYQQLWTNNYFIPAGTSYDSELKITINTESRGVLKPQSLILLMQLMAYIRRDNEAEFIPIHERTAVTDEILFTLIYEAKRYCDPELDRILAGFRGLHEIACCEELINEKLKESAKVLSLEKKPYAELMLGLLPNYLFDINEKNNLLIQIENEIKVKREALHHVYGMILEKMAQMREAFPYKDNPNFHVLYPLPLHSLSEFLVHLVFSINFKIKTKAAQRWERIEKDVNERIALESQPKLVEPPKEVEPPAETLAAPAIVINPRVLRWFDPQKDPFLSDPKYINKPQRKRAKIRFIHNFSRIVDDLALKYGKSFTRANKKGDQEQMISMALQAETPFSQEPIFYTLTMTFDVNGQLYHRTLTKKSQGGLVDEMVASVQYEMEFPP